MTIKVGSKYNRDFYLKTRKNKPCVICGEKKEEEYGHSGTLYCRFCYSEIMEYIPLIHRNKGKKKERVKSWVYDKIRYRRKKGIEKWHNYCEGKREITSEAVY